MEDNINHEPSGGEKWMEAVQNHMLRITMAHGT
jgi:hypothetical protein